MNVEAARTKEHAIIFTDLDGTLLRGDQTLSPGNRATLEQLGDRGIFRVVATGRSLYSASRVLDDEFPIDYLATSSGAGIFEFRTGALLKARELSELETSTAIGRLVSLGLDFMVHARVPDNHRFEYYTDGCCTADFERRCEAYRDFCSALNPASPIVKKATQFLVINRPTENPSQVHKMFREQFPNLTVIRTTSPLDNEHTWFELFPTDVSKGKAAAWLCQSLGVSKAHSMAVGNDYNDLDLLEWSPNPFVVGNAPSALKDQFSAVAENEADGFSEAVGTWLRQ